MKGKDEKITIEKRDLSIDILKFLAVIMITWSHFDEPLGKYGTLATGGSFGNTLFFFISGYTLLISRRNPTFFNWYKRRINRIYPSVFAWAVITTLLFGWHKDIIQVLLFGGGAFVTAIMVCYLFFYPIKRFVRIKYWWAVMMTYLIIQGAAWFIIDRGSLLIHNAWVTSSYFLAMLVGALVGYYREEVHLLFDSRNRMLGLWCLLGCSVISYYVLMYIEERWIAPLELINIIPLIGFTFALYGLCCHKYLSNLQLKRWGYWTVRFIGSLCLEVYIVQPPIITNRLNYLFPLNLLILFITIILAAYFLRTLGRLWSQTFKEEDYNWKEAFKPF